MIKGREDARDAAIRERLAPVKHRIAVMSGKGGVGKSTVSVNLAWALARRERSVGLLDADVHGPNVPHMLGISEERFTAAGEQDIIPIPAGDNLVVASVANIGYAADTALIWRGPVKLSLITQFLSSVLWGDLDYLVIDTPPGTGDEVLTIGQYIQPMTGIVIVTSPQDVALLDSRKSVNFAESLKIPVIGIIENMADGDQFQLFGLGGGERAAEELQVPFLGRLALDQRIVSAGDGGVPYLAQHSDSRTSRQFETIVERIEQWCKGADVHGA